MRFFKNSMMIGLFCFVCLLTTSAGAHFMWLNVNDYTPDEGHNAMFTVGWGHHFYNPVGDILCCNKIDELVENIYMVNPKGKKITVNALNEFQYESADELSPGTYLALVQRKEGFSTKTAEGYKRQSRKGLKNVIRSRYLGMYGKAIINVGDSKKSKAVTKPMGIPLEIVPLDNPSVLKKGDYFRFQLLYQGKPVSEPVNATFVGFSTEDVWAYTTRTGKDGVAEIKILETGIWVIKANHKAPYPYPEEADEYSYTTSLSFEIR